MYHRAVVVKGCCECNTESSSFGLINIICHFPDIWWQKYTDYHFSSCCDLGSMHSGSEYCSNC